MGHDPSSAPKDVWECLNCGAHNPLDEEHCHECGADTDGYLEDEEEEDEDVVED